MSTTRFRVGTVGFPAAKKKLFTDIDIVEVQDALTSPPKTATGLKLRQEAPSNFSFSVLVPRHLVVPVQAGTTLKGEPERYGGFLRSQENERLWTRTAEYARGLGADTLVLVTPAEFTPTTANCDAMRSFLTSVDRAGLTIAWEMHGPWSEDQSARIAQDASLVVAVDPLHDEPLPGPRAYFRFGPFAAMGSRIGIYNLERIAKAGEGFDDVICVFATDRAYDDARNLRKMIAGH
ncbi:MAG: DUF72 domain-containing protein [Myxococcota bacterium]|jgi:uncharacterized protein YecE (DUF72 family)|nr:DUF72 domain-containing protein [Myxococcota bacterium]